MKWRMIRGWLIALVIIAGIVGGVQYYLMRPQPVDVRVYRVKKGLVEETVTSTKAGSVRSRKAADLSVENPGTLVKIFAREGTEVKAGDPLISLDPRDAEAALAVAKKELASAEQMVAEAKARWDDANREYERLKELGRTKDVPQSQVDQAETSLKVTTASHAAALARVDVQKAALERAELTRKKCDILAPFDGVIAQLHAEEGEWVTPGKFVMKLLDPHRLYVRAELDEVDMGSVKVGLPVRVTLDPYKDRKFQGTITKILPYVTEEKEQNRTVIIEVELDPGLDGVILKHGLSADVEVILRTKPDVVRIPTLALLEGSKVLVVDSTQKAKTVKVKVGLKNWEFAEVLEGVSLGDPIIVSLESEKVKEGVPVKIVQESEK